MITRTVTTYTYNVLCVNIVEKTNDEREFTFPTKYKDDTKLFDALRPSLEANVVPVTVLGVTENVQRYGLTLEQFLENAVLLPPVKSRKEGEVNE